MQKLLIPIAPEQHLDERFSPVFRYANSTKATVVLLTVIEEISAKHLAFHTKESPRELLIEALEDGKNRLLITSSELKISYPSINFEVQVNSGIPHIEIMKASTEEHFEFIVVDANMGQKRNLAQFGSNTRCLFRQSSTPIWAISRVKRAQVNLVVAAIDIATTTQEGKNLNESVLRNAFNIALENEATLEVFHSYRLSSEGFMRHRARMSELQIAQVAQQEFSQRESKIEELLLNIGIKNSHINVNVVEGDVRKTLPEFIEKRKIELLVMGTLCRTGIPGFLMGNTAESILDGVECSVLAIKPEGM